MEYAVMDRDGSKHLVHVSEIEYLQRSNSLIEIAPHKKDEIHIVFGLYKPQSGITISGELVSIQSIIQQTIGKRLVYLQGPYCIQLQLVDIQVYPALQSGVPFAALVEGEIELNRNTLASFKHDDNISLQDNILKREGIFSLERTVIGRNFTLEDWKGVAALNEPSQRSDQSEQVEKRIDTRENRLHEVLQKKKLNSHTLYAYMLTHTYGFEDTICIMNSSIEPQIMEFLIAYIQLQASDIDPHYGMSEDEVMDIVLMLYDNPVEIIEYDPDICEIDLFLNWETWCGYDKEIMDMELFRQDELQSVLRNIVLENDTKLKE
ncbi:hypothetical protein [Paenibacillus sp. 1A_MP2]|uniref:hypothetical protein n=1 Tax=Paenibacillus sp. 1A_MP2 TaxID=3457495 RepID=UPI003FCE0531